jgi:hypothetical protein
MEECSMSNREMTSRRAATGISQRAGSRGKGKQYNPPAEIIRLPSGSIVSIPRFEPIEFAEARLKKELPFALFVSLILWGLIGLAVWGLISVFL